MTTTTGIEAAVVATGDERPALVGLADAAARDPGLVGAKAAALARARAAGLPVLPGFVVTTAAADGAEDLPGLRSRWEALSARGARPLVVRSSSTVEDGAVHSMAGVFTSVVGVTGWSEFLAALRRVQRSRRLSPAAAGPMAVLVQPFLDARVSGVLFGADPVTGRTDRLVVAAVAGTPERLVSGAVDGSLYVLSRRGRRRRAERPVAGLGRAQLRLLAALARRAAEVFGGPQDVEWALDASGQVRLLQSRPITTGIGRRRARGPVFGPGPVAETFPDPLAPLEQDLWLEPLRAGMREALLLTGLVSRRQAASSPVIVSVGGRVAVDLTLLGSAPVRHRFLARLDLRGPARRLAAAWRLGRLRVALPGLALDLLEEVDHQLLAVPPLAELSDAALADLLHQSGRALSALHGMEILVGQLVRGTPSGATGAAVALQVLARERARGSSDAEIASLHPVVLALAPPRVGAAGGLPAAPPAAGPPPAAGGDPVALRREALRLRVRWVQELTARAATLLGRRLARRGVLREVEAVRSLGLPALDALVTGEAAPPATADVLPLTPPLPTAFRLGPHGNVVPLLPRAARRATGRGAGGGTGTGPVHQGDDPPPGSVLVVRTLDPGLAAVLPGLAGLVAETGSVLSHLAILAREYRVPTVVAHPDALRRFPPGTVVTVDGDRGEVRPADDRPSTPRPTRTRPPDHRTGSGARHRASLAGRPATLLEGA